MANEDMSQQPVTVHAANVGGIDETSVDFTPGVTILTGRNATNRTSLLQAIMAALGSDDVSLKADAEEGHVELSLGDETYTRTLQRRDHSVSFDGEPYLEETDLADLFAFLLEANETRRAVSREEDLRELIMRPVDTDAIEAEIEERQAEKRAIADELEEIESLKENLPPLEQQKRNLENQIEEKRSELEEKEAELEAADANVEERRQEKDALEEKLDELRDTRSDLESVRRDIDMERKSIESLQNEQTDLEKTLEELPKTPAGQKDELDAKVETLRSRKQELEAEVSDLQSTIQFNEEMVSGSDQIAFAERHDDNASSYSITDQIVEDTETVVCWTCGTEVGKHQIETTLDELRELRKEKLAESNDIDRDLDELTSERRELEDQQQERDRVERKLDQVEAELDDRKERRRNLKDRRDSLTDEVETLETEVEALQEEDFDEILDLHREANQLEFEIGRLESDLDDAESEIETIESRLSEQEQIEERRAEVQTELEEYRTRIDRLEQEVIEQFNDHMDTVLEILDYANLERIWIERVERTAREGRRKVTKSAFELHIVRRTDAGVTYEDTIDHLSESEREVMGLIFALAGYLVHNVHETVPFMLLDSLEAIDAQRISLLMEYLEGYTDYLVVALLPEDANALNERYQRVTEI
ncbi:archaea-specific SMC-related protein [Halorussus salinisoli]|uniref:archaea-specific SMC-related protein n=1 Tax=Halorussus salinisoli TaxID=2558242 RepID=UPI0010C16283|nr:archaea-specific SMC-related protein [Halorussus salinisoli]